MLVLIASPAMEQRRRTLGLAAIGLAVFGLLTLTALGSRSLPGTTRSVALSWTVDVIEVIKIGVGVIIIGAVVWGLITSRRDKDETKKRRKGPRQRRSPLAVLVVLAAAALMIWLILNRPTADPLEEAEEGAFSISRVDFLPLEDVGAAWPLLVLVAMAAIAAFAVSALTKSQPDDLDQDAGSLLADSLSSALSDLDWSDDPRSVIIKAYHDIQAALAESGMPRLASEAPREYLERVLSTAGVQPDSITRLTTLFELARFSDQDLGPADVAEAQAALESVLADLAVAAR